MMIQYLVTAADSCLQYHQNYLLMIGKKGLLVYIVVAYNIDLYLNNYAVLLESFISFSFSFKPGCCTGKASKELISYTSTPLNSPSVICMLLEVGTCGIVDSCSIYCWLSLSRVCCYPS